MTEARDKALAARKAKRNPNRCNPDTEFTLGFDAGVKCSETLNGTLEINWAGLYVVVAKRAAQYEAALREAGLSVRDALDREVFRLENVADAWDAAVDTAFGGMLIRQNASDVKRGNPYRDETKEEI